MTEERVVFFAVIYDQALCVQRQYMLHFIDVFNARLLRMDSYEGVSQGLCIKRLTPRYQWLMFSEL
jgi:hypothetical protein